MNTPYLQKNISIALRRAFTLIELLVVIAVISLLAGLIFPVTAAVNRAKIKAKVQGELSKVNAAIEDYKMKLGHFPPDNPKDFRYNQLYYELIGVSLERVGSEEVYRTLDGSSTLLVADVPVAFGADVAGFVNANAGAAGADEVAKAKNFLGAVRADQYLLVTKSGTVSLKPHMVLGTGVDGPFVFANDSQRHINPWRYNSSNPTNNPNGVDLWVDVLIGGKTNRFSNWNKQPFIVSAP